MDNTEHNPTRLTAEQVKRLQQRFCSPAGAFVILDGPRRGQRPDGLPLTPAQEALLDGHDPLTGKRWADGTGAG